MRDLKSFEKDLNKCSKCGLCQSVCPVFKLTKNECTVSKGKFLMLHGVTKGDLKLSKKINKYIDMCLKCQKCKNFCPSDIDVCQILYTAKFEYNNSKFFPKLVRFLQSDLIFGNLIKFTQKIRNKKQIIKSNCQNLVYFKGCVNEIFPNTYKYLKKILGNYPINIITPDFKCCGIPFLSEGNLKQFEQNAKYNIEKLSQEYDYIVTDCSSCESTLLDYPKYIENFNINSKKFINWGEFIAKNNFKFSFNKPVKVTFHKPCHLKNDNFFAKIINNCTNVEYIKMKDYDECCGFSGTFAIKNPKLSKELIKQKAQNIIDTGADYVITTCPSCIAGLKLGLFGKKIKTVSLLEFLSKADKIEY